MLGQTRNGTTTDVLPFSDLIPAIPVDVQLAVTAVFTALYAIIFIACYVQLWLLLCLGYTRRLHPFSLLWLALAWSGLRILLFSFYWPYVGVLEPDDVTNIHASNGTILSPILAYFLYAFPSCIQFWMLCFVASFAVGISSRDFEEPTLTVRRYRGFLVAISILFLFANVSAVALQAGIYSNNNGAPLWLTATRVFIQDCLFVFVSIFLVIFLRRVATLPHVSLILESLNTGRCGLLFTGFFCTLLFVTRSIYDIIALFLRSLPSFNYGWINLSDHAEITVLLGPNAAFGVFAIVLLVWDFLPTAVVLFLFRLRRPQFIRAPGATNGAQLWGADNLDDSMRQDWAFRINENLDDNEALLGAGNEQERFTSSTPTFPMPVANSQPAVTFGVGSG